jgi:tyrosyl-tRNA synthetase
MTQSAFLQRILTRGYMHQCTNLEALDALLAEGERSGKPVAAYIGFDCTAPSLHVGSLMQIMILRHLQQCGHKPIVLLGGFTTKIGDPSGKDASRNALDDETIARNKAGIRQVFENFLTFGDGDGDAVMVDNDDWLGQMNLGDFLRNAGAKFSVNRMVTMDSVRLRLERESHLSFLEFSYMLMQSYDFVELYQRYGCRLQIGGSDQWGNIVMGVDLQNKQKIFESPEQIMEAASVKLRSYVIKYQEKPNDMAAVIFNRFRELTVGNEVLTTHFVDNWLKLAKAQIANKTESYEEEYVSDIKEWISANEQKRLNKIVFGLTTPLLTTASGAKMGKTADGAVWLNPDMLSPYDYWQFWRNCDDADVERFLKLFTDLSLEDITAAMAGNINEAKKILATEATALLHGRDAALTAAETARRTFEEGALDANLPTVTLSKQQVGTSLPAFKLFHLAGLAASGGEARKLIQGGGARINDEKVTDENASISLASPTPLKLSAGKKKHVLVVLEA